MASKYTRINRSIEEFKNFLDYYQEEYYNAYINIRRSEGWRIQFFEDEIYQLVENIYSNLYDGIYPMLLPQNPSTDEEILRSFEGNLIAFKKSEKIFDRIIEKSEDKMLSLAETIVYDLLSKAIPKLKEVVTLAKDDLKDFRTESARTVNSQNDFMVGIITATITEHNAVLNLLKDYSISSYDSKDSNTYYEGFFINEKAKIKIVLTKTHHQGIPAASTSTTKMILKYNPKVIFLVGHQAGNKNLKRSQKLGHILIGEESVDYQQNEIIQKSGNTITIEERDRKRSININSWLKSKLELFAQNQIILDEIKENYYNKSYFPDNLKAHIGKIVSGSALLRASERFDEIIRQNAGLVGLDMETHGFYYACENTIPQDHPMFVSIKSISDYGEQGANYAEEIKLPAVRQDYACYSSANFTHKFIMNTF